MIELSSSSYSLADAYEFLKNEGYSIVRKSTEQKIAQLVEIHPEFKEATHRVVKVFNREKDQGAENILYLVFSNLGQLYFSDGDVLETFKLDKKDFFFNIEYLNGEEWEPVNRQNVVLSSRGQEKWTASFDYYEIFNHFGLDGSDDFAPFVGFYFI
ncbi:hypothetical protein DID78_01940 [Candidatus Marinamargulisbacteria bacterium SCGC AG-343-D04]|nr:hypothetical protein DID78_01940 [Candidatus Marinamargulisbacteria bacterium SCGC AG-343-D04]